MDFWKCKIDSTFYHGTFIPGELSRGMVISVKETWHKLLFNHTALDAQAEQGCPKRAPLQMTSPQDFLSAFFFFCGGVNQASKRMDFSEISVKIYHFKKLKNQFFKSPVT